MEGLPTKFRLLEVDTGTVQPNAGISNHNSLSELATLLQTCSNRSAWAATSKKSCAPRAATKSALSELLREKCGCARGAGQSWWWHPRRGGGGARLLPEGGCVLVVLEAARGPVVEHPPRVGRFSRRVSSVFRCRPWSASPFLLLSCSEHCVAHRSPGCDG